MVRSVANMPGVSVSPTVKRIIASGQMNRREYLQLTSAILANHRITEDERRQINRVLDYIQIGRLRLVD